MPSSLSLKEVTSDRYGGVVVNRGIVNRGIVEIGYCSFWTKYASLGFKDYGVRAIGLFIFFRGKEAFTLISSLTKLELFL